LDGDHHASIVTALSDFPFRFNQRHSRANSGRGLRLIALESDATELSEPLSLAPGNARRNLLEIPIAGYQDRALRLADGGDEGSGESVGKISLTRIT